MSSPLKDAAISGAHAPPRQKRAQVSKACQRCKKLQKGCSESRPCQRCIRVGLEEQCVQNAGQSQQPVDTNWSYPQLPASLSPETFHATPFATVSPQPSLPPTSVIGYCFQRFFAKLYPTIPILSPEYAEMLVVEAGSSHGDEAQCLITAVCAVILIQVEESDQRLFEGDGIPHSNSDFGKLLFEEAMVAHHHLSSRFNPCLERALATFFLYAGHASLFHHSQAFYFLRDTATLWQVLRVDEGDALRRELADRLFWVTLVSERSHGIRYRRPVTLQVTPSGPDIDATADTDTSLAGLRSLVALFRPLDTAFFALLNQEDTVFAPRLLSPLDALQTAIGSALEQQHDRVLCETQLSNLTVTQLWLLVILWQVRLRLGLLVEETGMPCHLTFHYPVEVGGELAGVIRAISLDSIRVHGVGINEKIFDVACAMVDVLSRVPATDKSGAGLENIKYFRRLIHQLPGGVSTYDALLDKHISNVLPNVLGNPGLQR
ncbi:hypothetical protein C8A00DRAFT_18938 [Chaetomidium leptoderma]|uniref:Zn(2)-C6 fungal-type domain-containing protein n=1 Tax=Chaetomidium leptoderma TaxID=669021 RepID=A0AAN6VDF7_9PEZI|nr:hypothetical protein C8A00DRAFT_18938 [Chaetomidium leptoderma]